MPRRDPRFPALCSDSDETPDGSGGEREWLLAELEAAQREDPLAFGRGDGPRR